MPFLKFTALRLGFVAVFFVICYSLGVGAIFSVIAAAVMAWCVTYLFFRGLRNEAAASLQRRFRDGAPPVRSASELRDADAEDSLDPNTHVNADRRRP
ncbi:DUF4229 domain-containing protein [uncultured Arthrobacter sp.]|uniref:DUF4229 domain-containing protein n=1 Tax=uncultured Arthrobacter sp. TaxID=114050 RepID=UPI00262E8AE7|nr:DUF4229 domain-containing protein [uncultured Arthrobacter sp.]